MTEEQLKDWFWDKFNSCYPVMHDDNPHCIFMFYDINYTRAKKLANILGKEASYPKEVVGINIFDIHFESNTFYCDHLKIWSFLERNGGGRHGLDISYLIISWISEYDNLKRLLPLDNIGVEPFEDDDYKKLKVLRNRNIKNILND
jgi:hypothetical protein